MKNKLGMGCNRTINWIILFCLTLLFLRCKNIPPYSTVEDLKFKKSLNQVLVRAEILKENERAEFRMDTLTKFKWDKMYAFVGNMKSEEMERILGFKWDYSNCLELFSENNHVIVFVKDNKVVSSAYYFGGDERYKHFVIGVMNNYTPVNKSNYYLDKQFDNKGNYYLRVIHPEEANKQLMKWLNKKKLVHLP